MATTRQDLIRQHLPEVTRYLEKVLGRPVERLEYSGTHCVAFVPGGQVDCTDVLQGWAEEMSSKLTDKSPTQSTYEPGKTRDFSVN